MQPGAPSPIPLEPGQSRSRLVLHALVLVAGGAALSWEVIWQLQASLALGISALGTALTLATVMGGMTLGSLTMGAWLRRRPTRRPLALYGLLELVIGLSGLGVLPGFALLEQLDVAAWQRAEALAWWAHVAGISVLLGPPTIAMGATIPLFGLLARQFHTSIPLLYGLNVAGACLGTLVMAFVVLPALGVSQTVLLVALLDLLVGGAALGLGRAATRQSGTLEDSTPEETAPAASEGQPPAPPTLGRAASFGVVFLSGLATFALEVSWFRALRASFKSTTDSFAIMLAAVLLPLALAAHLVPWLRRDGVRLGGVLATAGTLVLIVTPVIERFDMLALKGGDYYLVMLPAWFLHSVLVLGGPVLLLGVTLPWVLEEQRTPRDWAAIYGVNTVGAIVGSLGAAWVLLPTLGVPRTAWLVGVLVAVVGMALTRGTTRLRAGLALAAGLVVAVLFESGVGRERVMGSLGASPHEVLAYREGPEATVSVIGYENGSRALVIDGFVATAEPSRERAASATTTYMAWMGHLPLMMHEDPGNALVICFGTGQTANAVRQEGPQHLDIVELNAAVLEMSHHFSSNEAVLDDPRVSAIVMDGRAWLRRTTRTYDAITMEPMPPYFAGVNALYSEQFYELVRARLNEGGTVAQWLPLHLTSELNSRAIVATFLEVFPNAVLWLDPSNGTGILLGQKDDAPVGRGWPGLARATDRPALSGPFEQGLVLDAQGLRRFASSAPLVTDDNQLLAYGSKRQLWADEHLLEHNLEQVAVAAVRP